LNAHIKVVSIQTNANYDFEQQDTIITLQVFGEFNFSFCEQTDANKQLTLLMMKEQFPEVFTREFPELCV